MAFFTHVIDLQAALNACLSVRDWEMLTETVQIPENFVPLALARLTELTLQELQVNKVRLNFTSVLSCSAELTLLIFAVE